MSKLTVYWRPGCGFCMRLDRTLKAAGLEYEKRNIWTDREAAEFVKAHNDGNETVPTVVIGDTVYSNPEPSFVLEQAAL
jgi:glutaredoxin-like protein